MKKKYTYRQLILAERDPFIQRQKISAFNALLQIMALLCFSLVISPITSGAWKLAVVYLGLGTWFLINDLFLNKIKNHILVLFTTLTGAYLILAYQFWIERNMDAFCFFSLLMNL